MSRSRPAFVSSSRAIASASRSRSSRSRRDLADDPDAEAGARERVPPDDLGGQAELLADQPHLVLEQGAQRLDQLELEVVGQAADVVVGLDVGRALAAAGLDHVGVERALHQEGDLLALRGGSAQDVALGGLEDPDELATDDLALLLGVGDARERVEETLLGVDDVQVDPGGRDEVALDLLGLALAEQAVVDEHTGELVADGPLHDGRRHRGVDAAGESADRPAVTDLGPDPVDLLVDDVHHRPGRPAARDLPEEVLQDPLAVLAVQHLRVPLHPGEASGGVLEGGHGRARRPGVDGEARRGGDDLVAVRHPRRERLREPGEQGAGIEDGHLGAAVLALAGVGDLAAEGLRHRHEAVADAEHRDGAVDEARVELRGARLVDATTGRRRG